MAYASLKCLEMSSTPVPRLSARDAAPAPTAFHPSHTKFNTSKLSKSYCGRILIISHGIYSINIRFHMRAQLTSWCIQCEKRRSVAVTSNSARCQSASRLLRATCCAATLRCQKIVMNTPIIQKCFWNMFKERTMKNSPKLKWNPAQSNLKPKIAA